MSSAFLKLVAARAAISSLNRVTTAGCGWSASFFAERGVPVEAAAREDTSCGRLPSADVLLEDVVTRSP
jgi:hypothetical protein